MIDIFISYSREDKAWVSKLAKALESEGYAVWWDPKILPGQDFEEIIQDALIKAKCVITVWSKSSIKSIWVKDESSRAYERKVFVPILYHDVKPPMPFGRIHSANFQKWEGKINDPCFQQLLNAINIENINPDNTRTVLDISSPRPINNKFKPRFIIAGVALSIFIGIYFLTTYIGDIYSNKTITVEKHDNEKIERVTYILDKKIEKKDKSGNKQEVTKKEENYKNKNQCADERLNSKQIRNLVSGKIAIGTQINVKAPYNWKETLEKNGTASFERKGRASVGKWKVENNQICWCYGACSSYKCKYIEQRNNCTAWYYIDPITGNETERVDKWLNIK